MIRFGRLPVVKLPWWYAPDPNPYTDEAETLVVLIAAMMFDKPNILEIGTAHGVTTNNLAKIVGPMGGHIVTVDVAAIPPNMDRRQHGETPAVSDMGCKIEEKNRQYVTQLLVNPSDSESLSWELSGVDMKYDLIFIDGDHSYPGVLHDFKEASLHLEVDGIILFHDIWWDDKSQIQGPHELLCELDGYVINMTHVGCTVKDYDRLKELT